MPVKPALLVVLLVAGCAGRGEELCDRTCQDAIADTGTRMRAVRACEELVEGFNRCGEDYGQAIEDSAADGDCANVIALRDADSFDAECMPWVEQVDCAELDDPDFELDASCVGQLVRRS